MSTVIKTLKDKLGNIVLPRTRTSAITMGDGTTTLEQALASMASAAHKSTHALGGSDFLSPSDIGAASSAHVHNDTDINLTDAVKTALALSGDKTISDALSLLARFNSGLCNDYLWAKGIITPTLASNIVTRIYASAASWTSQSFLYSDALNTNGKLVNPQTVTIRYSTPADANIFKGKYWAQTALSDVYFTKADAANAYTGTDGAYTYTMRIYAQKVTDVSVTSISYLNSTDSDAYPPTVSDGYTYIALGQIGNGLQIATGSYVGNGTYGNEISLTFPFAPKFVYVQAGTYTLLLVKGGSATSSNVTNVNASIFYRILGNTVYWYNTVNASLQLNAVDTYYYVAIG